VAASARLVRLSKHDWRSANDAGQMADVRDGVLIKKLDAEEQVVFGEVYAPGFPDSQGDFMSAEEVKKMAYNFMRKGVTSNIDVNHSQDPSGSYVVESFIARPDDPTFLPDSWVIGVKISDAHTWGLVKSGELNGFSLDGVGVRTDAVFEIEMPELLKGETDDVNGHTHSFVVKFDEAGNFLGGHTNPGPNGHVHLILHGTVTEKTENHTHRFSFVEGVLNAQIRD
jgi:Putative phage serine protease XkdF